MAILAIKLRKPNIRRMGVITEIFVKQAHINPVSVQISPRLVISKFFCYILTIFLNNRENRIAI